MRGRPNDIAESGEELQQNGGRVGFGVGGNGVHDTAGEAVIGVGGKCGPRRGSGRSRGSRLFVLVVDKILHGIVAGEIHWQVVKQILDGLGKKILDGLGLGVRRSVRQQL